MTDQLLLSSIVLLTLLGSGWSYLRGWRRLRIVLPGLATLPRLLAFGMAAVFVFLALVWPLHELSRSFLLARTFEKVLLAMLAAPLFWLSAAFHIVAWSLPTSLRRQTARFWFRSHSASAPMKVFFQPGLIWFLFLASFLTWHDSIFVSLAMPNPVLRTLAPLWLFAAALLYWWQVVGTGPRRYTTRSPWVRLGCLLSVEVPNVATGMYIAFHEHGIYDYYIAMRDLHPDYFLNTITMVEDQTFSGALNWVFGSMVYFGSFILVLNSIWRSVANSSQPQPPLNWDADEKFIMPGLEGRLKEREVRSEG